MAPTAFLLLLTLAVVPQDAAMDFAVPLVAPAVEKRPAASAGGVGSQQLWSERHREPQPEPVVLDDVDDDELGQGWGLTEHLAERAEAPQRLLRGGRRDDYEEEHDDDDDQDDIMDVSGAARVKGGINPEKVQVFLKDVDKLYARGFRSSHALRSKTGRYSWQDVDHFPRHQEPLTAPDQPAQDTSPHDGANPNNNVVLVGRKSVNLTGLSYVLKKPYLTVQAQDLNRDDKVRMYVSVAFEEQVTFRWFLNDKPFEEYESMQTVDVKSFTDPAANKTLFSRVSMLEVDHLLKLPTTTGKYEVRCAVTADLTLQDVKHVFEPQLTDFCPPANCFDRHAICSNGKCICAAPYPVMLSSVHTTCRTESFLETPCYHSDQCLYTTNNSECIDQGWCACRNGYGRTVQHFCVQKTGVNSRCDSDAQCKAYNASCILSHCTCNSDSVEEGDHCIVVSRSVNRLHSNSVSLHGTQKIVAAAFVVGLALCCL